jgi:hypothetical protein
MFNLLSGMVARGERQRGWKNEHQAVYDIWKVELRG